LIYLDTSVVVAALTNEVRTEFVQAWLGNQAAGELAISDWVLAEFSAALSIKLRTRQISATERAAALAGFARLCADSFEILSISSRHFRRAAAFADQYVLGLRAGDALHLAICADDGSTLTTLDRQLSDAGLFLGVKTALV